MLKRLYSLFAVLMVAGFMAGCQGTLSVGPNSQAAEAYTTIAQARASTTALLNADKITAAKGQELRTQFRQAQDGVDAYFALRDTDLGSAEGKLAAARAVIQSFRAYLITQGATFK